MLKACWDCIAGDQQRRNDDPYSVHLNGAGGTQGPPWQSLSNGNMFPTPTLRARNQIIIKGQLTTDRRLNMAFATSSSIMCQIDVANRPDEGEDFLEISSYGNNIHKSEANTWLNDGTQYVFRFAVNGNGSLIDVFLGIEEGATDQYIESVAIDINNLKLISVNGEVEKLTFIFKP